jgi:glycosyltransferase involved in cell wall biosynthesis
LERQFVITYTGDLCGDKRDPTMLLQVIEELIMEKEINAQDIRVRFYGPHEPRLIELKGALLFPEIIEINGFVSRSESIIKQLESTVLLIIQWNNPYTSNIYGGKVFEYLGTKRPIIALTNNESVLGGLISRTGIGYACSNKAHLKEVLRGLLEEYKQTGTVKYTGVEEEVNKYRWEASTKELADILNRISR